MSVAPVRLDPDWVRLRAHVRTMLGGRVPSGADAEDIVQDVLLRVFRGTGGLRDGDRFASWLAVTVRNALADQLRARQRHPLAPSPVVAPVEGEVSEAPSEPDDTARKALVSVLRSFVARLPAIYREVVTMSDLDGLPHVEIARRLSISVSGVKSRVQRGREQLHRMLTDCCQISLDARGGIVDCVPRSQPGTTCCSPRATLTGGGQR